MKVSSGYLQLSVSTGFSFIHGQFEEIIFADSGSVNNREHRITILDLDAGPP